MLRTWRKVKTVHLSHTHNSHSCTTESRICLYSIFISNNPFCICLPSLAEELQKVLLEQIDFRRRLEQEFHALKGTSPFPVFRKSFFFFHTLKGNFSLSVFLKFLPYHLHPPSAVFYHCAQSVTQVITQLRLITDFFVLISDNFQDQMKRELAYREEMVQQLQMVRLLMTQSVLNAAGK